MDNLPSSLAGGLPFVPSQYSTGAAAGKRRLLGRLEGLPGPSVSAARQLQGGAKWPAADSKYPDSEFLLTEATLLRHIYA